MKYGVRDQRRTDWRCQFGNASCGSPLTNGLRTQPHDQNGRYMVAMGANDTLGLSGGARRIQDGCRLVWADDGRLNLRIVQTLGQEIGQIGDGRSSVTTHLEHAPGAGQGFRMFGQTIDALLVGDDHDGIAVGYERGEFRSGQPGVQWHDDPAGNSTAQRTNDHSGKLRMLTTTRSPLTSPYLWRSCRAKRMTRLHC